MRCEELSRLLHIYWQQEDRDIVDHLIAAHIRDCSTCALGLLPLSTALLATDTLTCEACQQHFPAYYEATHPELSLAQMSNEAMAEVAIHLSNCATCREQYREFALISEREELDERCD